MFRGGPSRAWGLEQGLSRGKPRALSALFLEKLLCFLTYRCGLGEKSAQALGQALPSTISLQLLDLSWNSFGVRGRGMKPEPSNPFVWCWSR